MPNETIVFDPELNERELDRETDRVDDRLKDVASDIPVEFDDRNMDALTPAVEPDMGGFGGGGAGGGAGAAAGAGALASRIPKPIAGVAAASALPVALAGGVGVGMLSAMQNASARLQTSSTLLSQAWNSVWRPIGDRVDDLFIRDIAKGIRDDALDFEEMFREGSLSGAVESLLLGNDRRRQRGLGGRTGTAAGGVAGLFGGALAGAKAGGVLGAGLGSVVPGAGTAAGGVAGSITGAIVGAIGGTALGSRIGGAIGDKIDQIKAPKLPEFPGWPNVGDMWPGWPDVQGLWPGWPSLSATSVLGETFNVGITGRSIITAIDWPRIDAGEIVDSVTGGGGGGGGSDDGVFGFIPGLQSGGRIQQTGVANVHRGEMVGSPEQLVSELADAVSNAGGGGGAPQEVDVSGVEQRLDRLHRDIRALSSAMDVSVEVGKETVARASSDGKRNRIADTDPTV